MRFLHVALAVALYALAMAYVEAAVVVDLNTALGQRVGELFPLAPALTAGSLSVIEAGRELATLVMLGAVGILAGRAPVERLAWAAVAFGAWDIGYYGWLHLFTGWPTTLETWDVLFLIPVPWIGPVWAPLLVSVALIGFGLAVARRLRGGGTVGLSAWHVAAGLAGGLLVIVSFTLDSSRIVRGAVPESYAWPVFLAGMVVAVGAAVDALWRPSRRLFELRPR